MDNEKGTQLVILSLSAAFKTVYYTIMLKHQKIKLVSHDWLQIGFSHTCNESRNEIHLKYGVLLPWPSVFIIIYAALLFQVIELSAQVYMAMLTTINHTHYAIHLMLSNTLHYKWMLANRLKILKMKNLLGDDEIKLMASVCKLVQYDKINPVI